MELLSVRGLSEPDDVRFHPGKGFETADHKLVEFIKAFRRVITLEFGILWDDADRLFLWNYLLSTYRAVNFSGLGDVFVALDNPSEFANEFRNGCVSLKFYSIKFLETGIWTVWPDLSVSTVDIMYIKKKVRIDGTQGAPEYFETNSGKLQYNYGTTPFPAISLLSYIVSVECDGAPYQDMHFNQVGDVVQSGSNIGFYLAQSMGGVPSGDGNCYADIIIKLQEIV